MHHQRAAKSTLPVEEAMVDPGPARLGKDGPGPGQEFVWIGVRVEPAMDEQRVADTDVRTHAVQSLDDSPAQCRLEQGEIGVDCRTSCARCHLVEQLLTAHALAEPHGFGLVCMRATDGCQHHHDLVVAHHPVDTIDAAGLGLLRPKFEHAHAVGPAVDHVAEIDQAPLAALRLGEFGNRVEQHAELGCAAMNIADGEHRLALQRERCGLPVGNLDGQGHGGDDSPLGGGWVCSR